MSLIDPDYSIPTSINKEVPLIVKAKENRRNLRSKLCHRKAVGTRLRDNAIISNYTDYLIMDKS